MEDEGEACDGGEEAEDEAEEAADEAEAEEAGHAIAAAAAAARGLLLALSEPPLTLRARDRVAPPDAAAAMGRAEVELTRLLREPFALRLVGSGWWWWW